MKPPSPDTDSGFLPALTGLRGFAAGVVVLSHSANVGFIDARLGQGAGQMGVILFFLLSGFLMSRLYLPLPITAARIRYYGLSRLGRVLPLYLLIIALAVVMTPLSVAWLYRIETAGDLWRHVGLISADRELWAVPVECQFYAVFLALWGLSPPLRRRLTRRGMAVGLVVTACVLMRAVPSQPEGAARLFYYLPVFLIGAGIGCLQGPESRSVGFRIGQAALGLFALPVFILLLPGMRAFFGWPLPVMDPWRDPVTLSVCLAVFLAARQGTGAFAWFLATAPMQELGRISYGLYLIHPLLIYSVFHTPAFVLSGTGRFAYIAIVSVTLALLSWRYVERPALAQAKRLAAYWA